MIHDIAIWKLALAGFVLASFSFLVGFFVAALLAAKGRADAVNEAIEEEDRRQVKHFHNLIYGKLDPDEQWKSARDAYGDKAEHET